MALTRKSAKKVYPSKKTINLAMKEKPTIRIAVALPLVLLVLVLAAAFSKFAVYDRFEKVHRAQEAVRKLESERDGLLEYTANYQDVQNEYVRYSTKWMTNAESGTVPRTAMLRLMEQELAPGYRILDLSCNGNVISMKIAGGTLAEVSRAVTQLYNREDVTNVEVFSATNKETYTIINDNNRSETVVDEVFSIVITMTKIEDDEEEDDYEFVLPGYALADAAQQEAVEAAKAAEAAGAANATEAAKTAEAAEAPEAADGNVVVAGDGIGSKLGAAITDNLRKATGMPEDQSDSGDLIEKALAGETIPATAGIKTIGGAA